MNEQKGKVTEKVILSMTMKEHRQAQAEVRNLIFLYCKTAISTNYKIKTIFTWVW